ncbi:reverse transcriptase [Plakobranchus ocellatus]|uniref:Reverse transcriptase n=1 Tax=Plakobranchus ocellatus TaxID=259542 RepID=A0AAV4BN48_9GAST|nr:reverse transcriptase [Plakobranchus ocellatus]
MKEVIGQTQTERRGLGSTTAKWWSKTEGKEKMDVIIDKIRNKEILHGYRRWSSSVSKDKEGLVLTYNLNQKLLFGLVIPRHGYHGYSAVSFEYKFGQNFYKSPHTHKNFEDSSKHIKWV